MKLDNNSSKIPPHSFNTSIEFRWVIKDPLLRLLRRRIYSQISTFSPSPSARILSGIWYSAIPYWQDDNAVIAVLLLLLNNHTTMCYKTINMPHIMRPKDYIVMPYQSTIRSLWINSDSWFSYLSSCCSKISTW